MSRFSILTEERLREAGWYPGRQVPDLVTAWQRSLLLSDQWELFPSAEKALLEFGGLTFSHTGPGVTCAREPFDLDPTDAMYENDRFGDFVGIVGTRLYPIGQASQGQYFLAIGEDERVFLLEQDIRLMGHNIDEALEHLLIGIKPEEI
jgi:hypothetical protein